MTKCIRLRRVFAALLILGLSTACSRAPGGGQAESSPQSGGQAESPSQSDDTATERSTSEASGGERSELTIAYFAEPPSLEPGVGFIPVRAMFLHNVYEPLVDLDDQGNPQPRLAESWDTSSDGRTYTFHLREARFHNGEPLTAEDVVAAFTSRMDDAAFPHAGYDIMESATATDERTVEVRLQRRSNVWLRDMAKLGGVIVPEASGDSLSENPIGTGPFRFERWDRGEAITLTRFDEYWGDTAPLERVVWRFIPDANAQVTALLAGDVDAIGSLEAKERATEVGEAGFSVVQYPLGTWKLVMNVSREPLNELPVRQALAHAIDQQTMIEGTRAGVGESDVCGWLLPWEPGFESYCPYSHDLEKARELLSEAGFSDGMRLEMKSFPPVQPEAELVQALLAEAGVTVEIVQLDAASYFDTVYNPEKADFQLTVLGDPDGYIREIASCPPPVYFQYCNGKVSELVQAADQADTPAEEERLYAEADRILIDDAVAPVLFRDVRQLVFHPDLTGYKEGRQVDHEIDLANLHWGS